MLSKIGEGLGLVALLLAVGCGADDAASTETTPPPAQGLSATAAGDPASDPEPGAATPAAWNGKCCTFSCTNGRAYYSRDPTYGTCIDYARYSCPRYHSSHYIEGSAYWGGCH